MKKTALWILDYILLPIPASIFMLAAISIACFAIGPVMGVVWFIDTSITLGTEIAITYTIITVLAIVVSGSLFIRRSRARNDKNFQFKMPITACLELIIGSLVYSVYLNYI